MIAELVPSGVLVVEADEAAWRAEPMPEEAPQVARAVEKRRREFAAGRSCARRALARMGFPGFAVLTGPNREPLWPPGVVGSITHCAGYCAAAVARGDEVHGIGIDAEVNAALSPDVARMICTQAEREAAARRPGINWPVLVFSAKESIYKAWYPRTLRWLGYHDAELTFDLDRHRFQARLQPPSPAPDDPPGEAFEGRFAITDGHVFTTVVLRDASDVRTTGSGVR